VGRSWPSRPTPRSVTVVVGVGVMLGPVWGNCAVNHSLRRLGLLGPQAARGCGQFVSIPVHGPRPDSIWASLSRRPLTAGDAHWLGSALRSRCLFGCCSVSGCVGPLSCVVDGRLGGECFRVPGGGPVSAGAGCPPFGVPAGLGCGPVVDVQLVPGVDGCAARCVGCVCRHGLILSSRARRWCVCH